MTLNSTSRKSFFLPHIERLAGYVPGEQPRGGALTKLNTNENPYPPSPRVATAIQEALDGRLRRYPDPVGNQFREAVARLHGVSASMILAGNGSDDLLTILTRAFVGPGDSIAFPTPSYILYRTLAELQNARSVEIPFRDNWTIDPEDFAKARPKLVFLANPNSPSGTCVSPESIARLAESLECPLVVDEAYADFAEAHAIDLVRRFPNVIVTRTLSKGYSLAGLRLGYLVANPEVVAGLIKVKDSYNCDTLSLLAGAAAIEDQAYLAVTRGKILNTRRRLTDIARKLGYTVESSQANFIWCQGGPPATTVYENLKSRGILVRLMQYPEIEPALRVTVGTDEEIDRLAEVWLNAFP